MERLIELPAKGRALIVTDLHGNIDDFYNYIELWDDFQSKDSHFILCGDFIHAVDSELDNSIQIVNEVMKLTKKYDNFHALMGNHEHATLTDEIVIRGATDMTAKFRNEVQEMFGPQWEEHMDTYKAFFKTLPIAVKTANGVFISHAGPAPCPNPNVSCFVPSRFIDFLWNRERHFRKSDLNNFLRAEGCQAMIVGHTPVDGIKRLGNQLIVSSGFSKGAKAYVDLDLEKEINGCDDILPMVKWMVPRNDN